MKKTFLPLSIISLFAAPALLESGTFAQVPVANTVPFIAATPSVPHQSWSGNPVTLKGTLTSSLFGTDTFTYDWNPGDGSAHCTGTVTNQYVIACAHTYTGSVGQNFQAVLTITDTTKSTVSNAATNCAPGTAGGACYNTTLYAPPPNLTVEVNNAIDNGLWYLHSYMRHFTTSGGTPAGDWYGVGGNADASGSGDTGPSSLECSAFENSVFLQTNAIPNPYSLDVQLCLNGIFDQLTTIPVSTINDTNFGSFNPDSNGNGIGVGALAPNTGYVNYQTGMMLDAIVASGTPGTVVPTGTALATKITSASIKGSGTGGAYTYKDAVFDMVDDYTYCQAPSEAATEFSAAVVAGGWHYTCQEQTGDNSVSQWAAIGIIPAVRKFGATVVPELHSADESWLDSSFTNDNPGTGYNGFFGYTSSSTLWGPYADTPSGLVQLAMNGLGRGTVSPGKNHLWDSAETFIRDNFGNAQSLGATSSLKDYYYGLFSFTKAMLLHDNNDGGNPIGSQNQPIQYLQSTDDPNTCALPVPKYQTNPGDSGPGTGTGPCYPLIDWYAAQSATYGGTDPTDGVARTIIENQNADGSWYGQNYTGAQNYFQTGISITMLNKTVFQPVPVACFTVSPSSIANGSFATLDGRCSIDQNPPPVHLTSYQWDISGDAAGTNYTITAGNPDCLNASCSEIKAKFTAPNGTVISPGNSYDYPVHLKVSDSEVPSLTAQVAGEVVIGYPPNPPTSNPGGPYNFCQIADSKNPSQPVSPFILDGSKSSDPQAGQHANGDPPSAASYAWDLTDTGVFVPLAGGNQVNVTSNFFNPAQTAASSFQVGLQVTDNDIAAFGAATNGTATTYTTVNLLPGASESCSGCVLSSYSEAQAATPTIPSNIQLYWTDTSKASAAVGITTDHYNIYRSTSSTFNPFIEIVGANSNPLVLGIKPSATGNGLLFYQDNGSAANPLVVGQTYYYRIVPATFDDTETCQTGNITVSAVLKAHR